MIAKNNMFKKSEFLVLFCLLACLASGCQSSTTASAGESLPAVYTSVASTLAAAASITPAASATPLPSTTPVPQETMAPPSPQPAAPQTAATQPISSSSSCNNAAFVSDATISDGSILYPGEAIVKTWLLQNTGSCTWSTAYHLVFVNGSQMSGTATNISEAVASGKQIQASVSLTVPTTEGSYTGYWRMADANGSVFGASFYVKLTASTTAETLTPSATATGATSTPTSTYTATATAVAVNTATATPTVTPMPSSTPVPSATATSSPSSTPTS